MSATIPPDVSLVSPIVYSTRPALLFKSLHKFRSLEDASILYKVHVQSPIG